MKILKKLLVCLCVLSLLLCSFNVEITEALALSENKTEIPEGFGDVNSDNALTAADARILLRGSVGLEEVTDELLLLGDYTGDGLISSDDARTALRVSVALDNIECIFNGHDILPFVCEPDCENDGYTLNKCTRCTYCEGEKYDVVKAKGHTLEEKNTPAGCTEDGLCISQCAVCGYVASSVVTQKASGHSFGVWEIKGSYKERVCKTCGYKETSDKTKTVYLTFDDGPGPYTERLLGILREYDVKATFFVTNQMPRYRYLLPMIVNDGHAIGVHTLTHQWSLYSSKQSYLNDFNAMHKIILDDTGVDTKIFRFPGGTNNTVSRSYCRGIMAEMARYMTDMGYTYYDWNVDCGDTLGYSPSGIASSVINGIKNRNTSIVLMHDIKYNTVEAMRTIIEYCLANGYEFAVIDESTPLVQFRPVN